MNAGLISIVVVVSSLSAPLLPDLAVAGGGGLVAVAECGVGFEVDDLRRICADPALVDVELAVDTPPADDAEDANTLSSECGQLRDKVVVNGTKKSVKSTEEVGRQRPLRMFGQGR
jgi:hypothetical protein